MAEEQRQQTPDEGVHDPEMTEQDEANAPDVEKPDDDKLTREIRQEGDKSA
jgi:hypothetical protein